MCHINLLHTRRSHIHWETTCMHMEEITCSYSLMSLGLGWPDILWLHVPYLITGKQYGYPREQYTIVAWHYRTWNYFTASSSLVF